MNKQILILGAAGNFGSKIARALAKADIPLVLAGRKDPQLQKLKASIQQQHPALTLTTAIFDIKDEISQQLQKLKPFVVINTCGPFQTADYSVALACINLGIHYIDLADSRKFVNDFHDALNDIALKNNCYAVSGASTVPCLSSAVLDHYKKDFSAIDSLKYGITPGQKTDRGLATAESILSYLGKPLLPYPGSTSNTYGWQNLYRQDYPELGKRWMSLCDIPDLDLLPKQYGLKRIEFSAGMESSTLHLSMWTLSWLVRWGLPINLENHASSLLSLSHLFDYFGSNDGGMHMIISGKDHNGNPKIIKWYLIAKNGDGPSIPTIPAVILAQKLISGKINETGAVPCVGLVTLEEYLAALSHLNIRTFTD